MLHLIPVFYSWHQPTMYSIVPSGHARVKSCLQETSTLLILQFIYMKTKWLQEVLHRFMRFQHIEYHFHLFQEVALHKMVSWNANSENLWILRRGICIAQLLALCGASKKLRNSIKRRWYQGKIWLLYYWKSCHHEMHHK